jgi:hypothetical protein
MKKSIGTHSFDSKIGKIETQFYRIEERGTFKEKTHSTYRKGEKRERRRSFLRLISKRGGVYSVF